MYLLYYIGPPYLLVSRHNSKNLLKVSIDGCIISTRVLFGNFNRDSSLRGLAIGAYQGNQVLYAADAPASSVNSDPLVYNGNKAGNQDIRYIIIHNFSIRTQFLNL